MDIHVCITESHCCAPETDTTLHINHILHLYKRQSSLHREKHKSVVVQKFPCGWKGVCGCLRAKRELVPCPGIPSSPLAPRRHTILLIFCSLLLGLGHANRICQASLPTGFLLGLVNGRHPWEGRGSEGSDTTVVAGSGGGGSRGGVILNSSRPEHLSAMLAPVQAVPWEQI